MEAEASGMGEVWEEEVAVVLAETVVLAGEVRDQAVTARERSEEPAEAVATAMVQTGKVAARTDTV